MPQERSASPSTEERRRLEALHHYQILDTPPDGAFDRVTALLALLLDVPIAIVSLVDTDRIWFKSAHGLDAEEVDRVPGLCASAVLQNGPYVIENAEVDPRSLANPLVAGELGLRFYAAVPLRTRDGYNLGVLTAIDVAPRRIGDREIRILQDLAQVVMDQMELRLAARQVRELHDELGQAHEDLKIRASHDALTGALNRSAILDHLDKTWALAVREGRPLALMMADVDRFKAINDDLGHLAGDHVLCEVTRRLTSVARASDAIGRFGGDEFLLVMYPCDAQRARVTAERIRSAVSAASISCRDVGGECTVTLSAGVHSTVATPDDDVRHLLQQTDDALYAAKRRGRDRTSFSEFTSPFPEH